jgi:hypothetical protein
MTDTDHELGDGHVAADELDELAAIEARNADLGPLPSTIRTSLSFVTRLPAQRVLDLLAKLDPTPFGELQASQPSRVVAFRLLLRDHPHRDPSSLWLAAYDVEVELADADPTSELAPTPWPPSARTTE